MAIFLRIFLCWVIALQAQGRSFPIYWAGTNYGEIDAAASNPETDLNRKGTTFGFISGVGFQTSDATFELSLGWSDTKVSAKEGEAFQVSSAEEAEQIPLGLRTSEVATRLAHGALSVRFPVLKQFQVGPVASILAGTDSTFGPEPHLGANPNVLLGVNLTWFAKSPSKKSPLALKTYLEHSVDLTIDQRDVSITRFGLMFGFGYYPKTKVITKKKTIIKKKTVVKYKPKVIVKYKQKVKQSFFVDAGIINFETGKSKIERKSQQYLSELAYYLKKNQKHWVKIHIESHTDKRGSKSLNQRLSRSRANAVLKHLTGQKISKNRIITNSNESSRPVEDHSSSLSLAKNRRVEIFIRGPKGTFKLRKDIIRLQQKYQLPQTCRGKKCK